MSLTSFLQRPEVRAGFRSAVTKPAFSCKVPILAPPLTKHYGLVGSAFDYLLRFYLERQNQNAKRYTWVAHLSLTLLSENSRLHRVAQRCLKEAELQYAAYLKTGIVSDELLIGTLHLATLDVIFRAGPGVIRAAHLEQVDALDVEDLRALISIVPKQEFIATRSCLLNPSFGWASNLVGGADCDVIIDDTLVEIKTTKYLKLDRSYIDQLIAYHILLKLSGISSCLPDDFKATEYELQHISVYFARHGYFHRIPICDVIDPDYFPEFARWFVEIVCPSRRERAAYYRRFTWALCQNWLAELRGSGCLKIDRAEKAQPGRQDGLRGDSAIKPGAPK